MYGIFLTDVKNSVITENPTKDGKDHEKANIY
jgi:hypothetical protein